jgi:hypothetical protein
MCRSVVTEHGQIFGQRVGRSPYIAQYVQLNTPTIATIPEMSKNQSNDEALSASHVVVDLQCTPVWTHCQHR